MVLRKSNCVVLCHLRFQVRLTLSVKDLAAAPHAGVDVVVQAVALVEPGTLGVALEIVVGDLAVKLDHVVLQLRDIIVRMAPGEPRGAVVVDQHGRVDVVPAAAPAGHIVEHDGL